MATVNIEVIKLAFEKIDGDAFEKYANAVFVELIGVDFIPLGGRKDWGADGVLASATYSKRPFTFFQFSVQEDFRAKIRATIQRLREVGRDVQVLYYATSRIIPRVDIEETSLGDEFQVTVRIRDGAYLANHVNASPALLEAYHTYLAPSIAYLKDLSTSPIVVADDKTINASVYVFLRNELETRETGGPAEGIADGLIIWALRDTGSTEGLFMTSAEIMQKIEMDVPGMASVLKETIPERLKTLRRIPHGQQRPIKYHSDKDAYCISFDIRTKMQDENARAESLKRLALATYRSRILNHKPQADEKFITSVSEIALCAIKRCLENEGIEFAAFLCGKTREGVSMQQSIDDCIAEADIPEAKRGAIGEAVDIVLQDALNKPTTDESLFYSRIASVYTLLFCLRTEPKLIHYFERLAGHLCFYVGADVLVQLLSERFLPEEEKLFSKTLRLVNASGGRLVLTEPVLEEVQHHIYAADQEFHNFYLDNEDAITRDNIEVVNRPLIRAYFRGRFEAVDGPKNWSQFVNNYCSPHRINSDKAKDELRKYLLSHVGMSYEDRATIERDCAGRDVKRLALTLEPFKKKSQLAWNDALMAHLVYVRRRDGLEGDDLSAFGLRTWWLTNEVMIANHTKDMVHSEGVGYLMRPDYLLNFLSLMPKKQQAKAIFDTLFPSLLGVHLAREHAPAHVERLHSYLQEVKAVDPARKLVLIAQQSDKLKADLRRASWGKRKDLGGQKRSIEYRVSP